MYTLVFTEEWYKSYSNQTGKFPITSSRGHKYIFVFYHFDTNSVHGIAIKIRNTADICKAWETVYDLLKAHGEAPNIHILDNECPESMKSMFREAKVEYQLVPPHIHRCNAAERTIRTFKNHFVEGLYTCDPNFPSREWYRLLPQCDIILNLLRSVRRNPSLSTHAALLGNFDFNRTSMVPLGTKAMVYEKPNKRLPWAEHGSEAWYIGPSMEHYRYFKCYMPITCSKHDAGTVQVFPSNTPFPSVSIDNYLRQAATDLTDILKASKSSIPSLTYGSPTTNAYFHKAQILKRATQQPSSSSTTVEKSGIASNISRSVSKPKIPDSGIQVSAQKCKTPSPMKTKEPRVDVSPPRVHKSPPLPSDKVVRH